MELYEKYEMLSFSLLSRMWKEAELLVFIMSGINRILILVYKLDTPSINARLVPKIDAQSQIMRVICR